MPQDDQSVAQLLETQMSHICKPNIGNSINSINQTSSEADSRSAVKNVSDFSWNI